jgi:hypothetical protein
VLLTFPFLHTFGDKSSLACCIENVHPLSQRFLEGSSSPCNMRFTACGIPTHQQGIFKTFICSRSNFPMPLRSFAIPQSPQVSQIHLSRHLPDPRHSFVSVCGSRVGSILPVELAGPLQYLETMPVFPFLPLLPVGKEEEVCPLRRDGGGNGLEGRCLVPPWLRTRQLDPPLLPERSVRVASFPLWLLAG